MRLYFIRHAQSESNELYAQTGSFDNLPEDPTLSPVGWKQVESLARFLRDPYPAALLPVVPWDTQDVGGLGLTHLYCSLMIRSVITGTAIAEALELPLLAWPEIHEAGGVYLRDPETGERIGQPGKNRSYFEASFPGLILPPSLGEEGWWSRPFEEREERPLRAQRFLDDLRERHGGTGDRVAIISHGGFYNRVLQALLGIREDLPGWFSLNNAAITRIDFDDTGFVIQYMNRASHLPPELIT